MHFENLQPLLVFVPVLMALGLIGGAFVLSEILRRKRDQRRAEHSERKYWIAEFAYRAQFKARAWLSRTRTPRLTYQGPPLAEDPAKRRRRK